LSISVTIPELIVVLLQTYPHVAHRMLFQPYLLYFSVLSKKVRGKGKVAPVLN